MTTLRGITILDFSRLFPGPLATNILASMGARVIKVEHPRRPDFAKFNPPLVNGVSTLYEALNANKEIREIDYTTPAGREEVKSWASGCDVLVEQFRPGAMEAWGLGYEALRRQNERLVYLSLSGYGQHGPYRDIAGHDLNYLAYSGILSLIRDEEGRLVIPGVQIADAAGAYMLTMACMSALFQRERQGRGAYVDVSMLDSLAPMLVIPATQYWGGISPRDANFLSGGLVNYNVYACAGGKWMALAALEPKFWNNFCEMVDKPDWKRDQIWELSIAIFPKSEVEALFLEKNQAEWEALAAGKDVCLSPVREIEEMEADPQIRHRRRIFSRRRSDGAAAKGFMPPFDIH
jgi:alpha-methylacyl-CoA racemase